MKTCYKVVKQHNDKLVSCVVSKKAQVEYIKDKWVKAPKWLRNQNRGPLVFETRDQAIKFTTSLVLDGFQIWECNYRCKINDSKYLSVTGLENGELRTSYTNTFPDGTFEVQQVRLIRRVL